MIKVSQLTRRYGSFTAVDGISFEIKKGEIVGLLGHNGAGKTTTLKMLTGYLEATKGDIEIAGLNLADDRVAVQQKIGYLSEQSPLYPEMTVCAYLEYVAKLREIPETQIAQAVRDAVRATDLGNKVNDYISTLSKGYCQRVGVAQAILHKPDILILDEPTNGLDPTQIHAMRQLITDLARTSTVIISTHIMQEVEAICNRVIIILNGRIAIDASMASLQKHNAVTLGLKEDNLGAVQNAMRTLPGVVGVSLAGAEDGHNMYSVEVDGSAEAVLPLVAKKVVESGWNLYRLSNDHRNLETVFREVNRGKGAAHV